MDTVESTSMANCAVPNCTRNPDTVKIGFRMNQRMKYCVIAIIARFGNLIKRRKANTIFNFFTIRTILYKTIYSEPALPVL